MGAGPVKISTRTTTEREQEQCTWRRRALSLSNHTKTVTLAPSYVWITLLFDHVVLHFEFVWQWKTHPFLQNLKQHCQKCWPPGWLSVKIPRGSERVKAYTNWTWFPSASRNSPCDSPAILWICSFNHTKNDIMHTISYVQPVAVKLVLWHQWMHEILVHPVMPESTNFTAPGCVQVPAPPAIFDK